MANDTEPSTSPVDSPTEDLDSAADPVDVSAGATTESISVVAGHGPESESRPGPTRVMVDPRGLRFSAALSVLVMAITFLVGVESDIGVVLLTVQAVVFGLGAFFGLRYQPYGWLFRAVVRPRIGPPTHVEDQAPPQFAQFVGFVFLAVALVGVAFNVPVLAWVALGLAIAAAFLNAVFGLCLGCYVYLAFKRTTSK